jgi:serine phosphatase RsbU (regulator of sigma subunit)
MPTFQVVSRSVKSSGPPKKRPTHLRKWLYYILRIVCAGLIAALIANLLFKFGLSILFFLLLPVSLNFIWTPSQLSKLFHGTLLYGLLTVGLAIIYYSAIAGIEFLIHTPGFGLLFRYHGPPVSLIIVVTTTLAWAIMLAPLHSFAQSRIERRFNVRDREMRKATEDFTATLREEIDLSHLRDRFLTVIQQTMQPYTVSLLTRTTGEQQEQSGSLGLIQAANDDPLITYMLDHSETLDMNQLQLDSPLLNEMKLHGAEILLPLISQGELLGILILGMHLNGEAYSREECIILGTLATQVAPSLRVAQMVQVQKAQVSEHERIEQELRTASEIQHTFLPKDVPAISGWQLVAYYQSARVVGGDFYDFLPFADGRLGLVIGDVAGKGIPAALVMTATRTMLRTAAQETASPGEVFARANELLYAEIPSRMFVTCFYAILDPTSGLMRFANAGHDLPYRRCKEGVSELRATGMPLGLMPGSRYEEHEVTIASGESILFYTDGLVEAHNHRREMFGFPRLKTLLAGHSDGTPLFNLLLSELKSFTGEAWEQEDDITMVTLQRTVLPHIPQFD